MIIGIGVDLVEIPRIKTSIQKFGDKFIHRIAHLQEQRQAPNKTNRGYSVWRLAEFWAARFAAKEAFSKALGLGIGSKIHFTSIGVVKKRSGQPELWFSSTTERLLKKSGVSKTHIALSHSQSHAIAIVILEGKST